MVSKDYFAALSKTELQALINCELCIKVPKSPMLTLCGHNFCKGCIEFHLELASYCPICNLYLSKSNVIPNKALEQILNFLQSTEVKPVTSSFSANPFVENRFELGKSPLSSKTNTFGIGKHNEIKRKSKPHFN